MDRRRFIAFASRWIGAGILAPGAFIGSSPARRARGAPSDSPDPAPPPAPAATVGDSPFPDIAVSRGEAASSTRAVIEAMGGMRRFVGQDQVVLLKPNVGFDSPPDWGATTHPEVVAEVIKACLEAGARRVLVVDHTLHPAARCFERSGLAAAIAAFPNAKLVSLDDRRAYSEVTVDRGKALRKVEIPVAVQRADVFINLPTAKSHSATGVSLGLKNLMGLVWDRHVFHQEIDLHQGIADLATVLKPQLTILSALRILKTGGPTGPGDIDPQNKMIAGCDPVAVDAYGVGLSTWNRETLRPDQVGFIRYAAEHGLGSLDLGKLRIVEAG